MDTATVLNALSLVRQAVFELAGGRHDPARSVVCARLLGPRSVARSTSREPGAAVREMLGGRSGAMAAYP